MLSAVARCRWLNLSYVRPANTYGQALMETKFPQISELLNDRSFTLSDSLSSASTERTVYRYSVSGDEIVGSFWGGKIQTGSLYGRAIELLYHCTTTEGEEFAGWSRGEINVDAAGRTVLFLAWGWLAAATGGTTPNYVELNASEALAPRIPGSMTN